MKVGILLLLVGGVDIIGSIVLIASGGLWSGADIVRFMIDLALITWGLVRINKSRKKEEEGNDKKDMG